MVLKGGGVQGEGVSGEPGGFLGKNGGTLGNIREKFGESPPPLKNPII